MSEQNHISFENFLICSNPNCKRPFSLSQSIRNTIDGVRFPNRDGSIIEAKCPRCHTKHLYNQSELWKIDNEQESEESKKLRYEMATVIAQRDTYKKLYEDLLVKFAEVIHNSQQSQKPTDTQMQPVG